MPLAILKQITALSVPFLLIGCALDPEHVRQNPGVTGVITLDGVPQSGIKVVYAKSLGEDCKNRIGSTVTDTQGRFRIRTEKEFKMFELFPVDGCEFDVHLCIADRKPVFLAVKGVGHKDYHSKGRVLLQKTEGDCKPPQWIHLECELNDPFLCKMLRDR